MPTISPTASAGSFDEVKRAMELRSLKKGSSKTVLGSPDLSSEKIDQGVMEKVVESGEFGESAASTVAFGAGLASLAKVKGAASLSVKFGRGAGYAMAALQGVDLARTIGDPDYRDKAKESLEKMDQGKFSVDAFQQGLTRLPSTLSALDSTNKETAAQFDGIEEQDARTDMQLHEMRLRKKERKRETDRINEDQRKALDQTSAEEKTRMAAFDLENDRASGMSLVRSYLERNGLV